MSDKSVNIQAVYCVAQYCVLPQGNLGWPSVKGGVIQIPPAVNLWSCGVDLSVFPYPAGRVFSKSAKFLCGAMFSILSNSRALFVGV